MKQKKLNRERRAEKMQLKKEKGITLIALVVTIVVLLILAGVSINVLFSDSGIIKRAQDAQNKWDEAKQNEQDGLNSIEDFVNQYTGEEATKKHPSELITSKNTGKTVGKDFQEDTVVANDKKGNQVVIPGNFKISDDSGDTVQQGIVIEDKDGNQFVWIPVSNINGDGSNKIIKDNGDKVEITLGRYSFKRIKNSETNLYEDGTPTIVQKGSEWNQTTIANVADGTVNTKYKISGYRGDHYELSEYRTSNEKRR